MCDWGCGSAMYSQRLKCEFAHSGLQETAQSPRLFVGLWTIFFCASNNPTARPDSWPRRLWATRPSAASLVSLSLALSSYLSRPQVWHCSGKMEASSTVWPCFSTFDWTETREIWQIVTKCRCILIKCVLFVTKVFVGMTVHPTSELKENSHNKSAKLMAFPRICFLQFFPETHFPPQKTKKTSTRYKVGPY